MDRVESNQGKAAGSSNHGAVWRMTLAILLVTLLTGMLIHDGGWRSTQWLYGISSADSAASIHRDALAWLVKMVMFLPSGVMLGWLARRSLEGRLSGMLLAAGWAGGLVLAVETLQLWLPLARSSFDDAVAGFIGAALGVCWGHLRGRRLDDQLGTARRFLATRPRARQAAWMMMITLLGRLAPWDIKPRFTDVAMSLDQLTTGLSPLHLTRLALAEGELMSPSRVGSLARWELVQVGVTAVLMGLMTWTLARAIRESFQRRGERSSPAVYCLIVGVAVLLITELAELLVGSRHVDVSEPIAGMLAMLLALALDAWRGKVPEVAMGSRYSRRSSGGITSRADPTQPMQVHASDGGTGS